MPNAQQVETMGSSPKLPPMRREFVSAQDVAAQAGVSRSAVSRAFTPGASIAPETRQKVMAAAEALGYRVNDLARGLLARRSRLVGLVASDLDTPFRAAVASALTALLMARGNVPTLVRVGPSQRDGIAAHETLLSYRAEATIFLSGTPPVSLIELARRNGQPLIALNRTEPGIDHVRSDHAGAARVAAERLIAAGCRSLAVVTSERDTPSLVQRVEAFQAAANKAGFAPRVVRIADTDYAGGLAAGRALFAAGKRPDGVFCVNDLMAFGVLDVARGEYGLAVPRDLCVIGFDDVPQAAWRAYDLATFRQDPEGLAAAAIEVLDKRQAAHDGAAIEIVLPATFIERGSVRPA